MINSPEYACVVAASGDKEFFTEVVAPFAEEVEKIVPPYTGEVPAPLRFKGVAVNSATAFCLLGLTIFVAKHLTGKFLDDVYAKLIQPRLRPLLEKVNAKLSRKKHVGQKSFNTSIWYAEFNVLVSVTVVGDSFDDILNQLNLLPTVHAKAISWISENGVLKPVHYYKIEGGKPNPSPLLADDIRELYR